MKRIQYQISVIMFLIFFAAGCTDVMEKKDLGSISAEDIWQDPTLLKGYMDGVLNAVIPGHEKTLLEHTEEGNSYQGTLVVQSINNVNNAEPSANVDRWHYGNIRNINKFLDNVDKCPVEKLAEQIKQQYIAQMKVMRAYLYFDMVRAYGGVPLILHEQRLDEDLYMTRAKTSECIAQIIADLDDAINNEDLPMRWPTNGADAARISKSVALALKGRILLTYASPKFSKETPAGTKPASQRWTEAYDACKRAKDELAAAGYGLFRPDPASPEDAVQTYYDMFIGDEHEMNSEMVWVRRYQAGIAPSYFDARAMRPPSAGGSGDNIMFLFRPTTLEMVKSYANADGSPFNGLPLQNTETGQNLHIEYSTEPFWLNREPRFYATICYNGCKYPMVRKQQQLSQDVVDGKMQHQYMFEKGQFPYDNTDQVSGGGDGINILKMVNRSLDFARDGAREDQSGADWPLIRYAEVLLNFAEAAAMTGHEAEAHAVLDAIRKRAGIPEGSNHYGIGRPTGSALIAAILNERKLELAFESFRYYDACRWRLYTDDLVPGATSLRAGAKLNGIVRHTVKPELVEATGGTPTAPNYEAIDALDVDNDPDTYFTVFRHSIRARDTRAINFEERMYFLRIPYEDHIKNNPGIEQTQGWTDVRGPGKFNPYE